ncbi:MAG TPA: polyhydroxyalkanoic acid system family protein [Xanthomonadales bacterium]|nr:polyhydroxyalkanoic acid system family protein [Xanthomonadales bacterium]
MSAIDIHARHKMSREDAQDAADQLAQDLADKFDIEYGWDEDTIYFERTGVNGSIKVDGKQIHIVAKLGFMLSMFKDRFENEIRRYLKTHFNCTFSD